MTIDDAITAGRATALADSGWGVPFQLGQVRNPGFWVFLAGMIAGVAQLIHVYGPYLRPYAAGLTTGVILFGLYTIPWLSLLNHHNRYTARPRKLLLVAFVWGAIASTYAMAIRANSPVLALYGKAFGATWVRDWAAGFTAPLTEETAKATALLLLLALAPRLVRSPYDGLLVGAFAGLGFQISEDITYALVGSVSRFGANQVAVVWGVFTTRAITGLFQHVLLSAVFCSGLMWLIGRGEGRHRLRGLALMSGAMLLHSGWDNVAAYGSLLLGPSNVLAMAALVAVAGLLLLRLTFRFAAGQEHAWIRAILAPEVATGLLTEAEVDAAAPRPARPGDGSPERRAAGDGVRPEQGDRPRGEADGRAGERAPAGKTVAKLARKLARAAYDDDRARVLRAEIERLRTPTG